MDHDSPSTTRPARVLVVEGGGMRGAYSAGAMAGLVRAGHTFDAVYAASSGACNSAYLLAGQVDDLRIWEDHLHGTQLLGVGKLLTRRCYLDLDYLIDDVFAHRAPLDVARLRRSTSPLHVVLTRADDGRPEYHDIRRARDPLRLLKASAALPVAYGRPVEYEGQLYLDGGIADPLPVRRAIEDGARELVVVRTRPESYRRDGPAREWVVRLASRPYPGAARAFREIHERYNDALDLIRDPPAGVTVRAIHPPPTLRLGRLKSSARYLQRATAQGLADAARMVASLAPSGPPARRT